MEAHGTPKGLHKYWCNKITVPAECVEDSNDDAEGEDDDELLVKTAKTPDIISPSTSTATPRPTSTPLHSAVALELEYELREAVAQPLYHPSSSISRTYLVRVLIQAPNPMLHGRSSTPNMDESVTVPGICERTHARAVKWRKEQR